MTRVIRVHIAGTYNERPTTVDAVGRLSVFDPKRIPNAFASRTQWAARGYRVKRGEQNRGTCFFWAGSNWNQFDLYHYNQCVKIKGKRASARRDEFFTLWSKSK